MNLKKLNWIKRKKLKIVNWLIVGAGLLLLSNILTYIFVDLFFFKFYLASAIAGIISNLMRFVINNYWIFERKNFNIGDFMKFQIGSGFSLITWWLISNSLVEVGVDYILAINLAAVFSTVLNLVINFLWVWGEADGEDKLVHAGEIRG